MSSPADLLITPRRIVSLVPSQTELLYFLGVHNTTVGITKFCIHPKQWQRTKTIIGGTKNILTDKIKQLRPDLIIANKEENVKEQIGQLEKDFALWVTDVNNLNSALLMINDIGLLTNTAVKARLLSEEIKQSFARLFKTHQKINTAYLIWRNPYMTIGGDTFIHDMLGRCGLQNIFANEKRYPVITTDEMKNRNCKLVLLSSEPYPFTQQHINELQAQLPYTNIVLVNGEMFSWYGSRLLYAVEYFKELITKINTALPDE